MQEELAIAVQIARGGDRVGAIYKAHQSLENSLSKFISLVELATNDQKSSNSFDPWEELKVQVAHVNFGVSVCLRLFSEHRVMQSSKGCETVEVLYTQKKSATERLRCFLDLIKGKLDGMLSPAIVLVGGRCLQRVNPESAGFFVRSFLANVTNSSEYDVRDAAHARIMECVVGIQSTFKEVLPSLLSLEVECFAECGNIMYPLDCEVAKLRKWISDNAVEELLAYEATCKRRCAEKNTQIMKKAKHRESLISSNNGIIEKQYPESAQHPVNGVSESTNNKAPNTQYSSLQLLLNPFRLEGWRLHASRVAAVLICILLLKLLLTGALKLVKNTVNAMRSPPRRQRQLTF
ncbi:unnamed protein product [Phytomonas sp. EM1]|nr:unnamed protein product [Phytomonas sp. EM1]|eukprot:CCW63825.1 unnamed protein product [Phytomonas sp. isolate EM1]